MKKIFIILALLPILIFSGCKDYVPEGVTNKKDYCSGVKAASQDLNKGIIRYEIRGMTCLYFGELRDQAKKKYNVEIDFSGCCGYPRVDYAQGYKDTVIKYLVEIYSSDPIPALMENLREKYMEPNQRVDLTR